MSEHQGTLIQRFGTLSGDVRVEARTYGIDVRLFADSTEYGLTVEQAKLLQDRLSKALEAIENADETNPRQSIAVDAVEVDVTRLRERSLDLRDRNHETREYLKKLRKWYKNAKPTDALQIQSEVLRLESIINKRDLERREIYQKLQAAGVTDQALIEHGLLA